MARFNPAWRQVSVFSRRFSCSVVRAVAIAEPGGSHSDRGSSSDRGNGGGKARWIGGRDAAITTAVATNNSGQRGRQ